MKDEDDIETQKPWMPPEPLEKRALGWIDKSPKFKLAAIGFTLAAGVTTPRATPKRHTPS